MTAVLSLGSCLEAPQVLFVLARFLVLVIAIAPVWALVTPRYRSRETLLSAAERDFYRVLNRAVGAQYVLFSKVRLADVLTLG